MSVMNPKVSVTGCAQFGGNGNGISRKPSSRRLVPQGILPGEHPGDQVVDQGVAVAQHLDQVDLGARRRELRRLAEVVLDRDPGGAVDGDLLEGLGALDVGVPDLDLGFLLGHHGAEVVPARDHVDAAEHGQAVDGGDASPSSGTRPAAGRPVAGGRPRSSRRGAEGAC